MVTFSIQDSEEMIAFKNVHILKSILVCWNILKAVPIHHFLINIIMIIIVVEVEEYSKDAQLEVSLIASLVSLSCLD